MSTLISSRKIAAYWVDVAPSTGTPFDDCHDKTVQYPGWYEDPPGVCHYYTFEETQRRCFSGRFTLQKQVELWEDTYEVDDGEIVAGRVSAYSSAGGAVVLGSIAAYAFFASNPVGWVVGAGLAIVTYGIARTKRDKAFRRLFIAIGTFLLVMSVLGAIQLL